MGWAGCGKVEVARPFERRDSRIQAGSFLQEPLQNDLKGVIKVNEPTMVPSVIHHLPLLHSSRVMPR
jgi:hypothetical protein